MLGTRPTWGRVALVRTAKIGAAIFVAAALTVSVASPAWAQDTFWMDNDTSGILTMITYGGCAPDSASPFINGSAQFYAPSDGAQWATLTGGYCPNNFQAVAGWDTQGVGEFASIGSWIADDPFLGAASLTCTTTAAPLMCSTDGLTSIFSLVPGASSLADTAVDGVQSRNRLASDTAVREAVHVRFITSLAKVTANRTALVRVLPYSYSNTTVTAKVILRDARTMKIIGTGKARVPTTKASTIKVKIPAAIAKAAAARGGLLVVAQVSNVNQAGTGDTTTQLTLERRS